MSQVVFKYTIQFLLSQMKSWERMRSRGELKTKLDLGGSRFSEVINAKQGDTSTNLTVPQLKIVADHFGVTMDEIYKPATKQELVDQNK